MLSKVKIFMLRISTLRGLTGPLLSVQNCKVSMAFDVVSNFEAKIFYVECTDDFYSITKIVFFKLKRV